MISETHTFYMPDKQSVERLRIILERQSGLPIAYDEAAEISVQLIALYECLARERLFQNGRLDEP